MYRCIVRNPFCASPTRTRPYFTTQLPNKNVIRIGNGIFSLCKLRLAQRAMKRAWSYAWSLS